MHVTSTFVNSANAVTLLREYMLVQGQRVGAHPDGSCQIGKVWCTGHHVCNRRAVLMGIQETTHGEAVERITLREGEALQV